MGTFSCPCCVSGWWCVFPAGSRGLLKFSQPGRNWQAGKYWMVSEAERYWGMFSAKNNGRTAAVQGDMLPKESRYRA